MNSSHYPSLEFCTGLTKAKFPDPMAHFIRLKDGTYEHTFGPWNYVDEGASYVCPDIMEMLEYIRTIEGENNHEYNIRITYVMQGKYHIEYERGFGPKFGFQDTLPNALAKMILWLVEHNYLSFE